MNSRQQRHCLGYSSNPETVRCYGRLGTVFARPFVGLLLALAILSQFACSGISEIGRGTMASSNSISVAEQFKEQFGTIGVTTARLAIRQKSVDTAGMARGALDGAMAGVGIGFKVGTAVGYGALVTGLAMCIVPTPACVVGLGTILASPAAPAAGAVSGAVAGSLLAESKQTIERSELAIESAVANDPLGRILSDHITDSLHRSRARAIRIGDSFSSPVGGHGAHPVNTILKTEVAALRLSPRPDSQEDINPPFELSIIVQSRLRRESDGAELSSHSVSYASTERRLTQWADKDAALFRAELDAAFKRMAEEMVDFLVLLYPKEVEPLVPRDEAQVHALKPTLRWRPFPAPPGAIRNGGYPSRIRAAEYELKVLEEGHIVYQRARLKQSIHEIEDSLPSCRDLRWQVRARFALDERIRVSRWSPPRSFTTPCYGDPSTWGRRRDRPSEDADASPDE